MQLNSPFVVVKQWIPTFSCPFRLFEGYHLRFSLTRSSVSAYTDVNTILIPRLILSPAEVDLAPPIGIPPGWDFRYQNNYCSRKTEMSEFAPTCTTSEGSNPCLPVASPASRHPVQYPPIGPYSCFSNHSAHCTGHSPIMVKKIVPQSFYHIYKSLDLPYGRFY